MTIDILGDLYFICSDIKKSNNGTFYELSLTVSDFKFIDKPIEINTSVIANSSGNSSGCGNGDASNCGLLFSVSFIENSILKLLNLKHLITIACDDKLKKSKTLVSTLQLLLFIWRLNQFINVVLVDNDKFKFIFANQQTDHSFTKKFKKRLNSPVLPKNNENHNRSNKKLK